MTDVALKHQKQIARRTLALCFELSQYGYTWHDLPALAEEREYAGNIRTGESV